MTKRLFIFAGYDQKNQIDDATVFYVRELSKLGDVIFYMDSDADDAQLSKIKSFTIYADAQRHGEYDFGSFKRGFIWAIDNNILNNYEFIYMVNSSMYGPFYDLKPMLIELESNQTDAFGIVYKSHKTDPHIESWFFGMRKSVFLSDAFYEFITGVQKLSGKGLIAWAYEHGFTRLLLANNFSFSAKYNVRGRQTYNDIKKLYINGMPFMKKLSFTRKHGALGRQILWVLNHIDPYLKNAIIENEIRLHGKNYINKLLTKNPIRILYRNVHHALYKLFIEGI